MTSKDYIDAKADITKVTRIAVAMCTYNGEMFLRDQLKSIAWQGRLPDEMVVCDDCSTDATNSLLKTFSDSAPFPVRIVSNKTTLGPAKNFEKSISLCDGDIIVLSDQDDIWQPQKLERLVNAFDQNPGAVYVFSDADIIDDGGDLLHQTMWDAAGLQRNLSRFLGANQLRLLLKHNLIAGASLAFRASFREVVLPIPPGWMHDYWIVVLGSALACGFPVRDRLLMYRRHGDQALGLRRETFRQAFRESIAADELAPVGKVEQFRELRRRVGLVSPSVECSAVCLDLLMQKEAHLAKRAILRSLGCFDRTAAVLAEASTGRYQRFSRSWLSIARDLGLG